MKSCAIYKNSAFTVWYSIDVRETTPSRNHKVSGRVSGVNIKQRLCHLADGTLAEVGLQDADPALLVRKRYVDELIQTARSQDSRVNDVWSVGGSNDEDVLLARHSVHLSQDLVDDTVCSSTAISHVATAGLSDGVQLVKEENARGCLASLQVEDNKTVLNTSRNQSCIPFK